MGVHQDGLKADIENDLQTLINAEEFAEYVDLNGQAIKAVVTMKTQDEFGDKPSNVFGKAPQKHGFNLIGYTLLIYYVAVEYEGRTPKQSEFIKLNGRRLRVLESLELNGLVKLECRADAMQGW